MDNDETHSAKDKHEMQIIQVGDVFAPAAGIAEGVYLETDGSGLIMIYNFTRPNAKEIASMGMDNPFEIRLTVIDGCIIVLSKAGDNAWTDCSFSARLSRGFKDLRAPDEGLGYALTLLMTDAPTGIVKSVRLIGLGHDFSAKFFEMATNSSQMPSANYKQRLKTVMRNYTTRDLLRFTIARYKLK